MRSGAQLIGKKTVQRLFGVFTQADFYIELGQLCCSLYVAFSYALNNTDENEYFVTKSTDPKKSFASNHDELNIFDIEQYF